MIYRLRRNRIVWKRAVSPDPIHGLLNRGSNKAPVLVKLLLPKGTLMNRPEGTVGYKCRADKALVLACYRGKKTIPVAYSNYDNSFKYVPGKRVYSLGKLQCKFFEKSSLWTCAPGIHFFWSKDKASRYDFT